MAEFETKTIKQIYDGFISSYTVLRSKYGDNAPLLEKAVVKSLGYAMAGVAGSIWKLLTWVYKQCFPQTCDLTVLKLWGNLIGVDYKKGESTNLIIKLSGVTASSLPTGVVYKDLDSGLIFKTLSQATAIDGVIEATCVCSTSGSVGNIPVGTILNIANPYDGIPQTATVSSISIQGTEDEDVEAYRKRVLYRFKNKAQGGSAVDYFLWATEVQGIADALPYIISDGIISLYLVTDGSGLNRSPSGKLTPNPFPKWNEGQFVELAGSGQMLAVAKSIEGSQEGKHDRRPINARVELLNPNYMGFSVEINGITSTEYNSKIQETLIQKLDSKRPNLVVLNYPVSNSKINKLQLSADVNEVIGDETFTSFVLKNAKGEEIDEAILGIGSLAYLSSLKINNVSIFTA